jgi:PAS domain S-box-containing protein
MSPRPWYPTKIGVVAAVYFGAAKLGLLAAVAQKVVSSAWPPTGVALATLVLFGVRLWPGIALGAFLLNWTSGVPAAGAAGIAVGNTLEAVTAALLLRRVADFRPSLARLRDVLALVTLAALASPIVSATIGVLSLWASGMIDRAATAHLWFVWWSGDAMGSVLVAPLLLAWAHAPRSRLPPGRVVEAGVLLVSLVGLTAVLLRPPTGDEYAIFPLIIWAALRFGVLGSATASSIVAALTIWSTVHGQGSFVGSTPTHDLLLLQMYLALLSVTGLVLAAMTTERRQAEQVARESEQRYRTLLENAPEAILVHQDGRWIFANRVALKLLHAERAEQLLDRSTLDIVHPDYRAIVRERIEREFATGEPAPLLEQQFLALDGTVLEVEVVGIPITLAGRQGGQIIVRDITERKRAAAALRESEGSFRLLLNNVRDYAIFMLDPDGNVATWNESAERIKGYTGPDILGRSFASFYTPEDIAAGKPERNLQAAAAHGSVEDEGWRVRKNGTRFWANVVITAVRDPAGALLGFAKVTRDLTERRQAEQAVRERQAEAQHTRERLEALSQRLLKALENERRLIARELHDQIGQALTAVKLNLESLRGGGAGTRAKALPLEESVEIVEQLMEAVRSMSLELRPSVLDDLGLAAALRWYADRQGRRAGFAIRVRTELPAERLASDLETACFRVAQEAITNVARHASAKHVAVDVRAEDGTLDLTVHDDGAGFDVAAVRGGAAGDGSIGLDGMAERVRLLGGDFRIDSQPGTGTTVWARFPLTDS